MTHIERDDIFMTHEGKQRPSVHTAALGCSRPEATPTPARPTRPPQGSGPLATPSLLASSGWTAAGAIRWLSAASHLDEERAGRGHCYGAAGFPGVRARCEGVPRAGGRRGPEWWAGRGGLPAPAGPRPGSLTELGPALLAHRLCKLNCSSAPGPLFSLPHRSPLVFRNVL